MTLRNLPKGKVFARQPVCYEAESPSTALDEWSERIYAADPSDTTINIYDQIGEDYWGDGFGTKKLSGILRNIGARDITVNINSPGGNVFDGLAMYDMLREHPAKVTVRVRGIAASAASVIAMAGDEIQMATGSMMMIHKAWGGVIGNEEDFAEAVTIFKSIDASMAAIYAARTGMDESKIAEMLAGPNRKSDGTWMTAAEAIELKFADAEVTVEDSAEVAPSSEDRSRILAKRKIEAALAAKGLSRRDRSAMLDTLTPRDASQSNERDAVADAFSDLFNTIGKTK